VRSVKRLVNRTVRKPPGAQKADAARVKMFGK
jgi:hypothetical protein